MSVDRNRQTLLRWLDAYNNRDINAVASCLADDYVGHMVPPELGTGREAYLQYVQMFFNAFPDLRVETLDLVAEGDMIAVRVRNSGTHTGGEVMGMPASGKSFTIEAADFTRFNNEGKIVEEWEHVDNLSLMQQLGAMPAA